MSPLGTIVLIVVGIAFASAAIFGAVLAYHFFRFSPDRDVSTTTISVYAFVVVLIACLAYVAMIRI